jgi:hypothetical protein
VQKRILPLAVTAVLLISLISLNCTKLDTTDIGGDQLPAVDNVNTFADTLDINSTQESYFSDSTYIGKYDDYALGSINNDPLFGTTNASIFMQLKPAFYPFFFGNAGDTISGISGVGIDSIVLCLKYKGFWGDSALPITLQVREVQDLVFRDSVLKENKTNVNFTTGTFLGSTNVSALTLGNYTKYNYGRDSIKNQIRIPITNLAWVNALFGRDSIKANASTNAFYSDSAYRRLYNGLAVISTGFGSNGLLYASLSDTSTKLEIYYRKKAKGATTIDSTYSSFRLNPLNLTNSAVSNTSNYIQRNRSAIMLNPPAGEHYLQAAPGSFVNLNIPGLATLSNRVVHRAEIIVEQIPTNPVLDEKLSVPNFLYLELKDTGTTAKWKPVYYDLNTSANYDPDYKNGAYFLPLSGGSNADINFIYFGGFRRSKPDVFAGGQNTYFNFNITRYVQQIVTSHTRSYDMRLSVPFNLNYKQYSPV